MGFDCEEQCANITCCGCRVWRFWTSATQLGPDEIERTVRLQLNLVIHDTRSCVRCGGKSTRVEASIRSTVRRTLQLEVAARCIGGASCPSPQSTLA